MFGIALLTGIFGYTIFVLGLLGWLYREILLFIFILFFTLIINSNWKVVSQNIRSVLFRVRHGDKAVIVVLVPLFFVQVCINTIGALGPELAFDALWYHLTFPKLYLLHHSIMYIPGGLLYYSTMPKLGELLYTTALAIGPDISPKLVHFAFGLLTTCALFLFAHTFYSRAISLAVIVIFYANLVVAWESTTAYIDLIRAFYEIMALWGFVFWWCKDEIKWLIISAVMVGLAIAVKLLALGSLFIFALLILYKYGTDVKQSFLRILVYVCLSLFVVLPWFVYSYIHTGNPLYPFFSTIYEVGVQANLLHPLFFFSEVFTLFTKAADPLSPIYIIVFPLIIIFFSQFRPEIKLVTIYSLLAIIVWYITPRTGGGRFILPYLPAFTLIVGELLSKIWHMRYARYSAFGILCCVSLLTIGFRGIANARYIPVILGRETKAEFLEKNLNFSFGDFYDVDGWFEKTIKPTDTVLLYGFHNLFYVYFPFVHESWVQKGDVFTHVAVQNGELPERYQNMKLVYENKKTYVKVYTSGTKEFY